MPISKIMRSKKTLAAILEPRSNSFNLLRIVAALCVVISHSFLIPVGLGAGEPLSSITPFNLGLHAVNLFFIISGLTLAHSIERNPDLVHYAWARCLRIFPALFVFGLIFAFVAGPLLTSAPLTDYFEDRQTWLYPFSVLVNFAHATAPYGIFTDVPHAGATNNPLWTLKYELMAYAVLAIVFSFSFLRRTSSLLIVFAAALVIFVATPFIMETTHFAGPLYQLGRYEFCFFLGVIAYRFRDHVPLAPWLLIITISAVAVLHNTAFEAAAYIVLTAHLVFVVGAYDFGILTRLSRDSDLSYGTYIYGWPIQQSLVVLLPGIGIYTLLATSLMIVPLFALASWVLIEKPVLRLKKMDPRTLWSRFMPQTTLARK
jgi:peptidoglycan/LPS O-acetylase OafA/YrhL